MGLETGKKYFVLVIGLSLQSQSSGIMNSTICTSRFDGMMRHWCGFIKDQSLFLSAVLTVERFFNDMHEMEFTYASGPDVVVQVESCILPPPRSNTALLAGDLLWLFGGCDLSMKPFNMFSDVWCFDRQWREVLAQGTAPRGRSGHQSALMDDRLLVVGGWSGDVMLGDVWVLCGLSETPIWACLEVSAPPRACFCMGILQGIVVIFGGLNDSFSCTDQKMEEQTDMVDNQVTLLTLPARTEKAILSGTVPAPRAFCSASVVGATLFCTMGSNGNGSDAMNFNDLYSLTPYIWSIETHRLFPLKVRRRVMFWLLVGQRARLLPKSIWLLPLSFLFVEDF